MLNANSVDPDQTPRSVASDLGLHYVAMSLLWGARHKRANCYKENRMMLNTKLISIIESLYLINST